jgi:putative phage-type endonuclease
MLTPEQHAARRNGLGGTDAAAIAGLSPWKTPLDVYLAKVEGETVEENAAMHWGSVLEGVVADEYARVTGNKIRRVNRVLAHPEHPFMLASLDRRIVAHPDGPGVLEIKTVGRLNDDWGETGSSIVPDHYALQVHQYLTVIGARWGHLAALFMAERELRIYLIQADPELSAWLIELEREFWHEHVVPRVPPAPRSLADAGKRWPRDTRPTVVAGPEEVEMVQRLAAVRSELARVEAERDGLELSIKSAIGEASALVGPDGKPLATWKAQSRRALNQKALRDAHPDLVAEFTAAAESRVFRLATSKGSHA